MTAPRTQTVAEYLRCLPPEPRRVVSAVRKVIRENLPPGYVELIDFGVISYVVPLKRYPVTYNGHPLPYAGLAARKNSYSLYLNCVDQSPQLEQRLRDAFTAQGKKLDMGKACIRFRKLEALALDAIAAEIASTSVEEFIAMYEACRAPSR